MFLVYFFNTFYKIRYYFQYIYCKEMDFFETNINYAKRYKKNKFIIFKNIDLF